MVKHAKFTNFEAEAFVIGNSVAIVLPKPCRDYIGVMAGDIVEVRIKKVRSIPKRM